MKLKKFIKTTALSLALTMTFSQVCLAVTYKDVPETHFAYEAISEISDMGYLVGDMSGNFSPSGYIDKFQTVDILSKMAGYKEIGASSTELAYQNQAYEKYKSFIDQYGDKFTRWNPVRDRQIAYLLDEGVLTESDLDHFVILSSAGVEQLRALSREEVAVFFVKLMGKSREALATDITTNLFSDDSQIDSAKRPYVYLLRDLGIMQGSQGMFSPRSAVTRAEMALLISKILETMPSTPQTNEDVTPPEQTSQGNTTIVNGTIYAVYNSVSAIQISSTDVAYNNKIVRASDNVAVTIDGAVGSFSGLSENMTFMGIIENNEFIQISAQAPLQATPTPTPTTNPAPTATPAQFSTIEGTITAVANNGIEKNISIEVQMLNLRGEVIKETRTYTIDGSCAIKLGGRTIEFSYITQNDLAIAKVSNGVIYELTIEEKNKEFTGTLTGKSISGTTGVITLSFEDYTNNTYDLRVVDNTTVITRKGEGMVSWRDLRIGDRVVVKAEYDVLQDIYAEGSSSSVDGYIRAIYISTDFSYIELQKNGERIAEKYYIIPGAVDMYSLTVGSEIRLRLDSREVSSVLVLNEAVANSATGYVSYVTRSSVVLKDSVSSQVNSMEFYYNSGTVYVDSRTGTTVTINDVNDNARIYVVFTDSTSKIAKTVTILAD